MGSFAFYMAWHCHLGGSLWAGWREGPPAGNIFPDFFFLFFFIPNSLLIVGKCTTVEMDFLNKKKAGRKKSGRILL